MEKQGAIGIIDSGVGGLTVAKEIANNLPDENIIYLGDSKNCPYGNKSKYEILALTLKMMNFLKSSGVKCVVIACNTISTVIDDLRPHFDFPIISIVESAAEEIASKKFESVGLIATKIVVESKVYDKLIEEKAPNCKVFGEYSLNLAGIIDKGDFSNDEINKEITLCIDKILNKSDIDALILGCTHYPIVEENFRKCYKNLLLVNPAAAEMHSLEKILHTENAENTSGGKFLLYTTGSPENYIKVIEKLGFKKPDSVETVAI